MLLKDFKDFSDALTPLLQVLCWPLLLLLALYFLRDPLIKFLNNIGEFTFKASAAGIEASGKVRQSEAAAYLGAAVAGKSTPDSQTQNLAETRDIANSVNALTPKTLQRLTDTSILWVDDQPQNNEYEQRALEALGIRVTNSKSTDDALMRLGTSSYDLIISDMGRPPDSRAGYTLLDAVRKAGYKTPYIIYAGSNSPEHKAETAQHGGQGTTNSPNELFQLVLDNLVYRN